MTAVWVLAQCHAMGVSLTTVGDGIRCAPGNRVTPELLARIRAMKPELLALLARDDRQVRVREAWRAAFGRLSPLARDSWPTGGAGVLGRVGPEMARDLSRAENTAEAAGRTFVAGGAWDGFQAALARWEALQRGALEFLARVCHDCGQPATAVVVLDDGRRLCGACVGA